MKIIKKLTTLFFLIGSLGTNGYAQLVEYNHPELNWSTINTEHFQVHFHQGTERTAGLVAKIAEEIYQPVTSMYQYQPDGKIHFIIRDHDDYSNGAAFYYDNKVEIWASTMDFVLRGSHNWLRNVVTHEFVHMISLGAARKMTRKIPAFYIQYMDYEPEKNPYVLYGFPNRIASYPLALTIIPNWLAEGVAQYQLPPLNYDNWDSHRDMILRTSVLEDRMLSFKEMGVFGRNSLGNEKLYNHGVALVRYIVNNFGAETLNDLFQEMRKPWNFTINGALKKAIGLNEKQLYQQWKNYLEKKYEFQTQKIKQNLVVGQIVEQEGFANLFPVWAPDGKKFAFTSNRGYDYVSLSSLYCQNLETGKTKAIKSGVNSIVSWSPDAKTIYYSRTSKPNKDGSHFDDIYAFDVEKKNEKRLTKNVRSRYPNISPDGKRIVFVTASDGNHNIEIFDLETKEQTAILQLTQGEQIFQPQWSPDASRIVYCLSTGEGRSLAMISEDGKERTVLLDEGNDARDPVFSTDGKQVYFSWDKTGIFNIYSMDVETQKTTQWTNVTGGAFMPTLNKTGELLYSDFSASGYRIAKISSPTPVAETQSEYLSFEGDILLAAKNSGSPTVTDTGISNEVVDYDDAVIPKFETKPYNLTYGAITFLPRIMFDYGTTKIGSYFYSGDILDSYNIFGGFALNRDMDYDLFGMVNYRKFKPTIFLEVYHQVRNHSEVDDWALTATDTVTTTFKYRYNLTEIDAGLDFKLNDEQKLRTAFIYNHYRARTQPDYTYNGFKFPATKYTYFIGRTLQLRWNYEGVEPSSTSEINPALGRRITLTYNQEFNKFINDFKLTRYGTWTEVFDDYNYTKLELEWNEYLSVWRSQNHALNFNFHGGWIDKPVHEFFNFFAGGMIGLRGYPFYSIEGRKLLVGRATYRFPIFKHLDMRLANLYFDKLYAGVFYDYGNAFNSDKIQFSDFKNTAGVEIRFDLFSFYNFPTRIFFNAAYGLDRFTKIEKFNQLELNYGKEWRYYVGILFGYLD